MRYSRLATSPLAYCLLLLVSACSDGGSSSSPPTSASVAAPAPTTVPPSSEAAPPVAVDPAAQAYVDAVNDEDLDALVAAFAPDGAVIDVSRRIEGRDAIRQWADREVIGGTLEVLEIAEQRPDGQRLLVRWAPGGSDGWEAFYDFTYADKLITTADLQYA